MSFNRENRYIVLKLSDIEGADLTEPEKAALDSICSKVNMYRHINRKDRLVCAVVESDWPEYDMVWKSIEERVSKE